MRCCRDGVSRLSANLRPVASAARDTITEMRCCRDGVSRLSAHLHLGMVSPFRVAREALAARSYGAGKFVDEFLTWREIAYAFCFHHSAHLDTLEVCAAQLFNVVCVLCSDES